MPRSIANLCSDRDENRGKASQVEMGNDSMLQNSLADGIAVSPAECENTTRFVAVLPELSTCPYILKPIKLPDNFLHFYFQYNESL